MFCHYMQEIHSLKAQLEAAKYDVIKYCIGTIVSISAVGLAVLRIVMWRERVHSFTHSSMETYKKRIGFDSVPSFLEGTKLGQVVQTCKIDRATEEYFNSARASYCGLTWLAQLPFLW
jgi:hypothetical protein